MIYILLFYNAVVYVNHVYAAMDEVCNSQKEIISNNFEKQNPITKFNFANDTKTSVQVTWAGDNSGKIVLVTTREVKLMIKLVDLSDIYYSNNHGKTFTRITNQMPIQKPIVRKDNGLQRNSVNNENIFLICYDTHERSLLMITEDGGENWKKVELDFILDQEIEVHPYHSSWLLTVNKAGNLYRSLDGGYTWKHILRDVQRFTWSSSKTEQGVIFAKVGKMIEVSLLEQFFGISTAQEREFYFKLKKSSNNGETWVTIKRKIFEFLEREKFLYVSEVVGGGRRRLSVSTDGGLSFDRVLLPTIVKQQFYLILGVEEDMVFLHVDNPDKRGDGTLFSSDSEGRIFRESLKNHFYPSVKTNSDFYKIKSMRGTYIASQLQPDNSIQSLITFNRGAVWQYIRKAENSSCQDQNKTDCYLQVTRTFSLVNNVASYLPVSSSSAVGLVIVHAHLANSLKNSKSDVFISSDGGYNWAKTLDGPHECVIADHGGLLVAIGENKQFIKFSTDEGKCWHEIQYTKDDIQIFGLLNEPGNKAMVVVIWGYERILNEWVIHVLDLSQLLNRECNSTDYEKWYAHSEMTHPLGGNYSGCFLGKKEVFMRLKKDSLCKNGYSHKVNKMEEICPCTEYDFECEYGYHRQVNSKKCSRNSLIEESICVNGTTVKIISDGYKKIPSDVCEGGFSPAKTRLELLDERCNEDEVNEQSQLKSTTEKRKTDGIYVQKQVDHFNSFNRKFLFISIFCGLLVLFLFLLGFVLVSRQRIIRQRATNLKYKVLGGLTNLSIHKDTDDEALITNEMGYETSSPSKSCKKKKLTPEDSDIDLNV